MNHISRKLCIALLGAAVIFAGCVKKPRPAPVDTTMTGPAAMGAVNPENVNLTGPSAAGLQPRPANAEGIVEDENTIRGLLKPVFFDFDSPAIKRDERAKITDAADYLKKNPQYRMLLEGHCDWRGTAEYNLGLGDRARAVRAPVPAGSRGSEGQARDAVQGFVGRDRTRLRGRDGQGTPGRICDSQEIAAAQRRLMPAPGRSPGPFVPDGPFAAISRGPAPRASAPTRPCPFA